MLAKYRVVVYVKETGKQELFVNDYQLADVKAFARRERCWFADADNDILSFNMDHVLAIEVHSKPITEE